MGTEHSQDKEIKSRKRYPTLVFLPTTPMLVMAQGNAHSLSRALRLSHISNPRNFTLHLRLAGCCLPSQSSKLGGAVKGDAEIALPAIQM